MKYKIKDLQIGNRITTTNIKVFFQTLANIIRYRKFICIVHKGKSYEIDMENIKTNELIDMAIKFNNMVTEELTDELRRQAISEEILDILYGTGYSDGNKN